MNADDIATPDMLSHAVEEPLGRVMTVNGSQASVGIPAPCTTEDGRATVGKFIAIQSGQSYLIGMITDVSADTSAAARGQGYQATARLDLMGEIKQAPSGAPYSSAASPSIRRSAIRPHWSARPSFASSTT